MTNDAIYTQPKMGEMEGEKRKWSERVGGGGILKEGKEGEREGGKGKGEVVRTWRGKEA